MVSEAGISTKKRRDTVKAVAKVMHEHRQKPKINKSCALVVCGLEALDADNCIGVIDAKQMKQQAETIGKFVDDKGPFLLDFTKADKANMKGVWNLLHAILDEVES